MKTYTLIIFLIAACLSCPFSHALAPKTQIERDDAEEIVIKSAKIFTRGISRQNVRTYGVLMDEKTLSFVLGEHAFTVPPYLAKRVYRVHITGIERQTTTFQKMGIGVGRRQQTIAVALVDKENPSNQLIIYNDNGTFKMVRAGETNTVEEINFNAEFEGMQRQDSFLVRTGLGGEFIDRLDGISPVPEERAKTAVSALWNMARRNPTLKTSPGGPSVPFFTRGEVLTLSRELIHFSRIAVLKDRLQRGRFLAIVDELNPHNYVVFERRGENVFLLGNPEQLVLDKFETGNEFHTINFTDSDQGAAFCQHVSRELAMFSPNQAGSFSLALSLQMTFGSANRDLQILKVNQVTRATPTGYQVKHKQPEIEEPVFEAFPLYILNSDTIQTLSSNTTEITWDDPDLLFLPSEGEMPFPLYLNYYSNGENIYHVRVSESFTRDKKTYAVYRKIKPDQIVTKVVFGEDRGFTIDGISWNDGTPVKFRNVSQISLRSIITQLSHSRYITIDQKLLDRFKLTEWVGTPVRVVVRFNEGFIEQAETRRLTSEDDFRGLQTEVDQSITRSRWYQTHREDLTVQGRNPVPAAA